MALKIERGRAIIRTLLRKKGKHTLGAEPMGGAQNEPENESLSEEPMPEENTGKSETEQEATQMDPAQDEEAAAKEDSPGGAGERQDPLSEPEEVLHKEQPQPSRKVERPSNERRLGRRANASSARELLTEVVVQRAAGADSKLRAQLTGTILIQLLNSDSKYLFDWTSDTLQLSESKSDSADCVMALSEQTLLKIASGDLNPQISMLSDKVSIKGKLSLAIYFFNLVAPGGHWETTGGRSAEASPA